MATAQRRLLPLLLAAPLAAPRPAGATVLERVTYSGYVVDYYCLSLVRAGGLSLDGSDVVKDPAKHTLHCLRDIPQCRDGFYLAGKNAEGEYDIKFKLDDKSHANVVALMDTFPVGHARDKELFAVTAVGMHAGDGVLLSANFTTCFQDSGCDTQCSGGCSTPADLDYTVPVRFLLAGHVVCMCLSWGCLLPLGVLWARHMRDSKWKPGGAPAWFQGHRTLQCTGVLLQLLGFVFVLLYKKASHFQRPHEIIGAVVVLLGLWQPINAQIRHLKSIGHPGADGSRTRGRAIWEMAHKGSGWTCVLLGVLNACLGPVHANNMRFSRGLVVASAIWLGLSLGSLLLTGVLLELKRRSGPKKSGVEPGEERPADA